MQGTITDRSIGEISGMFATELTHRKNTVREFAGSVRKALPAIAAGAALIAVWFGMTGAGFKAQVVTSIFAIAVIGWVTNRWNETFIALTAAVAIVFFGAADPKMLFASLGDSTVWLLVASFIVAAVVSKSGLTDRLTRTVLKRVSTTNGLFFGLTAVLFASAFVIPATSGRAALMLPVYAALCKVIREPRIRLALSILFPAIILLSAVASLTGAGAHLVAAEMLGRFGGEKLTFFRWMLYGTPFAIASCVLSTFAILRLFLTDAERNLRFDYLSDAFASETPSPWTLREKLVAGVVLTLIALWMLEPVHGVNGTILALAAALLLTVPSVGGLTFKGAVAEINWNLIVFLAATMFLGEMLINSGAAAWIVTTILSNAGPVYSGNFVVVLVVVISLLAHLVINSRTARSSVLVPVVAAVALAAGLDLTALVFVSTAAAGFCLTLTVSAKPVLLFSQVGADGFTQEDLFRLSAVLLPLHFLLLLVFAFLVYPLMGLEISPQFTDAAR